MKINGLSGTNTCIGIPQALDSVGKSIQNQITNAQKRLQEISSNEEMSLEERMQKRQEIQQQINDLNNQLRQHQIELRKEKQQAKGSSMEEMLRGNKKEGSSRKNSQSGGLSQVSMKAIISADATMEEANIQGSVAAKLEGRAGVLQQEIKLDAARGGDTKAKEKELAEVEQKASNAAASQINSLGEANKEMEEAAKANSKKENINDEKEEKNETTEMKNQNVSDQESANADISEAVNGNIAYYTPVDVRL